MTRCEDDEIDCEDCYMYLFVMVSVVGGCVCLTGIICNVMSLYTFWRGVVQTVTSYQLIWLAVVDTILLLVWFVYYGMFYAMVYFHDGRYGDPDHVYWRVIVAITPVSIYPLYRIAHTCSIWLTVFIAVYRYLAMGKPYSKQYSHIERHGQKYVVLVLGIAVLYNIPYFCERYFILGERNGQIKLFYGFTSLRTGQYKLVYWNIMYGVFVVCLPFMVLFIMTIMILVALKKRQSKKRNMQTSGTSHGNINSILISIIIVFLACQTPYLVAEILRFKVAYYGGGWLFCSSLYKYYRTSLIFPALNSAANPFIYFTVNKKFRSSLATHCHCT